LTIKGKKYIIKIIKYGMKLLTDLNFLKY